jgi:hypothetical protein
MMREGFLACAQHAPSLETMQGAECETGVNSDPSSSGSDSPVALLSSCVRGGNWQAVEHPLPPALSQFINTFLGERAVARETVKKAAPVFRRYDGSF